jgi:hypothetical protein
MNRHPRLDNTAEENSGTNICTCKLMVKQY